MTTFQSCSLFLSILLSALIAGLFYSYSCSVNPGLAMLGDADYLKAMQFINKAILNPVFFISFMGTLFVLPVSVWLFYGQPPSPRFYYLLGGFFIYVVGVFGITMFGNVPLNNVLDNFDIGGASVQQISALRLSFESSWNKFHLIRTLAAVASLILSILAGILK